MNWYKKYLFSSRKICVPEQDYDKLMALINKISRGETDYNPEELQLQQNYPEALEVLLKQGVITVD